MRFDSSEGISWKFSLSTCAKPPMILSCKGNDYEIVELENNGVSALFFVHDLVADAWVPNPENLPYIRHKNGNTLDNRADNLEWTNDPEAV